MKKKLYFLETNGYNMLVSVDDDNNCRYLTEMDDFPYLIGYEPDERKSRALDFLESSVEDDSSWDDDCTYEQIFEEFPVEIIAEIEKEL